jgi:hypothetical protein
MYSFKCLKDIAENQYGGLPSNEVEFEFLIILIHNEAQFAQSFKLHTFSTDSGTLTNLHYNIYLFK